MMHAVGAVLLGVDIGTSASKAVLARPDGSVVAAASRPHGVSRPRPGWAEQDAEGVWWSDFRALVAELLPKADGPVAGVCLTGLGPCVLPADHRGAPLRPAILYGIDTRAASEVEELTRRYGAEAILQRGGSLLSSQSAGPKLLWLRRHEPAVWSRTRHLFMCASFMVFRQTGEYVLDHHSASRCDPLYDLAQQRWIDERTEEVAPGLPLPRLLWAGEPAGRVTPEASVATGIPEGTVVAAGTIDTRAEAAGVGLRRPGDAMVMYGSTLFIVETLREARPHPRLWTTPTWLPGVYNLSAGMATAGALMEWVRAVTGGPSFEQLLARAAAAPPGSNALVVLPYFAGERTPLFDPRARGLIAGLTLSHGDGEISRAVLEGIAYGVRHNLEVMREAGAGLRRIVAVGGGTRGRLWPQIVSDVTGYPQELPRVTIGASYGAAFLGGVAAGLVSSEADWNSRAGVVEPDPGNEATYRRLYAIYRGLYPATRALVHSLADLQSGRDAPSPG